MPLPTDDDDEGSFTRSHHSPPQDAAVTLSPPRPTLLGGAARHDPLTQRNRSRRRKRAWKRLMWVKQSYPDNYTDQATFLENLQRNPRLKPYDFWPLVNDSTVILQHVCSVIIFIVCFVAIFQERASPVSVVSCGSLATFVGWILWERWVSEEDWQDEVSVPAVVVRSSSTRRRGRAASVRRPQPRADGLLAGGPMTMAAGTTTATATATATATTTTTTLITPIIPENKTEQQQQQQQQQGESPPQEEEEAEEEEDDDDDDENRVYERLETIKSALLIFSTLLGLSPILKSLTRSTSSDSIWAMSFWLLALNVFFFDYSGGVGAKFPASLSTNAGLMASTVLASRLPSTKQVFSLTLFSIEVFGLFPVFRRHVRHRSWRYHVVLTALLVLGAGLGVGIVLGDGQKQSGFVGMVFGLLMAAVAAGGCSWWLIGLQKYKNEIRGPWDPARPIIMSRTRWDGR
ncbi:hypothetical protein L249_4716 [Ophiocordyceps polyrhachis-furcata BCC 54312]|uniref:GPI2-domain-containing protein n=1 Tax=Ophiocordyceps polyrhachis-furcata BCC 54312 TaxID=1330021 RepID=A0A367L2J5_9HYPO|nr:hypothetical protein L249_4716 [Ophiocordyceps polyrhachis-furcata BCC 54312]